MLKTERSRREIPWTSAISDQREGEKKVNAVVVGSLKEKDQVERLLVSSSSSHPKNQWCFGGTQSPFGEEEHRAVTQAHGNVFIQREGKAAQEEPLHILIAWERPQTIWRAES